MYPTMPFTSVAAAMAESVSLKVPASKYKPQRFTRSTLCTASWEKRAFVFLRLSVQLLRWCWWIWIHILEWACGRFCVYFSCALISSCEPELVLSDRIHVQLWTTLFVNTGIVCDGWQWSHVLQSLMLHQLHHVGKWLYSFLNNPLMTFSTWFMWFNRTDECKNQWLSQLICNKGPNLFALLQGRNPKVSFMLPLATEQEARRNRKAQAFSRTQRVKRSKKGRKGSLEAAAYLRIETDTHHMSIKAFI